MSIKKIICFTLAATIALSLAACGDKHKQDIIEPTIPVMTQPTDEYEFDDPYIDPDDEEYVDPYIEPTDPIVIPTPGYEVVDKPIPPISKLMWEEKYNNNLTALNVATTPFEFNLDVIYNNYISNEDIYNTFLNITKIYDEKTSVISENTFAQTFNQTIELDTKNTASKKTKALNVKITLVRDVVNYENISKVKLEYNYHGRLTPELQNDLYRLAEPTFGKYTEYLVYGKDKDGLDSNKNVFDESKKAPMYDIIEQDKCSYFYSRNINENTKTITISMGVHSNELENNSGIGYKLDSIYSSLPYNYEDVLPGILGNSDPFYQNDNFSNDLFKSINQNYTNSVVDEIEIKVIETKDSVKEYALRTEFYYEDTDDIDHCGQYDYEISYKIKDGEIIDTGATLLMDNALTFDINLTIEEMFDEYVKICDVLLPGSNLSSLATCPTNEISTNTKINTNILGKDVEMNALFVGAIEKICIGFVSNKTVSETALMERFFD